ncbi:MAG: response regulator [Kiritimatiellae bacterium]|nr:response regulator [Kiritimatiellia bacterium]
MKTVLAVDDEAPVLRVICEALERRGYRVIGTTQPAEAPLLLDAHKTDLLILDCMMPLKSGLEIFDELKRKGVALPVLFATGYPDMFSLHTEPNLVRWKEHMMDGLTDLIYKPFGPDALCAKVEGLIGPPEEDPTT